MEEDSVQPYFNSVTEAESMTGQVLEPRSEIGVVVTCYLATLPALALNHS